MKIIISLTLLFLVLGCRSRNKEGGLSHDPNMQYRSLPLEPCDEQGNPDLKSFDEYGQKILDHIYNANLPLKKYLSSENHNPQVAFREGWLPNASACGWTILIDLGVVKAAKNDAQVAATIAHELAHIAFGHTSSRRQFHPEIASAYLHPLFWDNAAWIQVHSEEVEARNKLIAQGRLKLEAETTLDKKTLALVKKYFSAAAYRDEAERVLANVQTTRQKLEENRQSFHAAARPVHAKLLEDSLTVQQIESETSKASEEFLANQKKLERDLSQYQTLWQDFVVNLGKESADFLKENSDLELDVREGRRLLAEARQAYEKARANRLQFEEKNLGSLDAHFNWQEQEADELGYEFYLRAGFDPNGFFENTLNVLMDSDLCRRDIELAMGGKKNGIERQRASHPTQCWRALDNRQEQIVHKELYEKIASPNPISEFLPGALANLKGDERVKEIPEFEMPAVEPIAVSNQVETAFNGVWKLYKGECTQGQGQSLFSSWKDDGMVLQVGRDGIATKMRLGIMSAYVADLPTMIFFGDVDEEKVPSHLMRVSLVRNQLIEVEGNKLVADILRGDFFVPAFFGQSGCPNKEESFYFYQAKDFDNGVSCIGLENYWRCGDDGSLHRCGLEGKSEVRACTSGCLNQGFHGACKG